MDGQAGGKTRAALAAYCTANNLPPPAPGEEELAFEKYFPGEPDLFTIVEVTAEEYDEILAEIYANTPEEDFEEPTYDELMKAYNIFTGGAEDE